MAGYITDLDNATVMWYVGTPFDHTKIDEIRKIQVDGDELTFALNALGLDPTDHNPRVQYFVGTAARAIAKKMPPITTPPSTETKDRIDDLPEHGE